MNTWEVWYNKSSNKHSRTVLETPEAAANQYSHRRTDMATPDSTPIPDGYKRCCEDEHCVHPDGPVLPATNEYYSKHPRSADRLQRQCKSCDSNRKRKRQQDEDWKQHRNEYKREYRKTDQSKKHVSAYKQTLKYKTALRNYLREYRNTETGRAIINAHHQKRRAKKWEVVHSFSTADWQHSLAYFNGCCAVCGRQLNDLFGEHTAAMDHWIPISSPDCPGTIPTNIVPLCHGVGGCNNRKNNQQPEEWLIREFGKRKGREINKRIQAYFYSLKKEQTHERREVGR